MSSYHPNYHIRDLPPPPPPPDLPPLPPKPPPRQFSDRAGDPWRSIDHQASVPQGEFSFRNSESAPQYPRHQDSYSRDHPIKNRNAYNPREYRQRNARSRSPEVNRRGRYQRPSRGRSQRPLPSDRPLLQHREGEGATEQTLGVDLGAQKFMSLEDITDSEEENMDVSDSDQDDQKFKEDGQDDIADNEPPAKRRAVTERANGDGHSVPRWSNPDPYSVLPPIDDTVRKRKDPVKLIRKAFKPVDAAITIQNPVSANDDFISFEDDDAESASGSDKGGSDSPIKIRLDLGEGPSRFDHADNDDYSYLGSRKRTFDDEIKAGGRRSNGFGCLQIEWVPSNVDAATPWLNQDTASVLHPGFRLHREICDFYEFVKPTQSEQAVRQDLLNRLQKFVTRDFPGCTVHCFGSFAAGLYLPNADMDIVIISESFQKSQQKVVCQSKSSMFKFRDFLQRTGLAHADTIEVIPKAKVPIVKFIDRITGIKVDISFENSTGIVANDTFADWKRQYPAMPILVTIIKQFLLLRGLNEVHSGGLGGFSVICLVVSLLQNMPRVQAGLLAPEEHLGEILIEFLDFYGNRIDISRTGISMNPPGYIDKHSMNRVNLRGPAYRASGSDRLAIIDPNKPDNDISGGSRQVTIIFDRFSRAHSEILAAMKERNRPSLLDWLLGADYTSVAKSRARLLALYNGPAIRKGDAHPSLQNENSTVTERQQLNEMQAYDNHERQDTSQKVEKAMNPDETELYDDDSGCNVLADTSPDNAVLEDPERLEQIHDYVQKNGPKRPYKRKIRAGVFRAQKLTHEYPELTNIPPFITPRRRLSLIAAHKNQTMQKIAAQQEMDVEQQRAAAFKRDFPGIPNVTDRLDVQTMRTLIAQHLLQRK